MTVCTQGELHKLGEIAEHQKLVNELRRPHELLAAGDIVGGVVFVGFASYALYEYCTEDDEKLVVKNRLSKMKQCVR